MRDFPPVVPDFTTPYANSSRVGRARTSATVTGVVDPDTLGPHRYLFWLLKQQRGTLLVSSLIGVVEWLPGWLGPYLVGRIVDEGILARNLSVVGGCR